MDAVSASFPSVGYIKMKYSLIIVLLFSFALPGFGQEGAAKEATARTLRFVCTAVVPDTAETLWLGRLGPKQEGKEMKLEEVVLSTRSPGAPVKLPGGDASFVLGEKNNDPEVPMKALASVKVPQGVRKGIVLLIPNGKKSGLQYHAHIIDEADFRYGDVYFLNLTSKLFQIRLGREKINLKNGKQHIYHPPNLNEPRNQPVAIYSKFSATQTSAEEWKLVTASTWRLRKTRKEFCIFYWDVDRNRPAIKALTAFPAIRG